MNTSPAFKKAIQNYLEKRASEDELFAITYKKENKSIDECCNYILECAKKGKQLDMLMKKCMGGRLIITMKTTLRILKQLLVM
ncbi:hypothetical protein JJC03_09300 [Flavobacterium oreochromis]|uniref:Cas9 inhibitor AcrIIA9 family protein n=1 Tax=Flavobacterium oreochromis TaxID=2906078 RepID=UPI001CE60A2B|nr:hypothetical protein JJC03_09300 [Flavobacterium oreochromis]